MRVLLLLLLIPTASAGWSEYFTVEDAAGDQAPFATETFDIRSITAEGNGTALRLSVTMGDDVRVQRGQHAVGIRGPTFHVHVACYIGQTTPVSNDEEGCSADDVWRDEGDPAAGVSTPTPIGQPIFSDDGRTYSIEFDAAAFGLVFGEKTDRVYAQSKMSFSTVAGQASPGAAGYSEADNFATEERLVLGNDTAPAPQPESEPVLDKDTPAPSLAPLAALLLLRRR